MRYTKPTIVLTLVLLAGGSAVGAAALHSSGRALSGCNFSLKLDFLKPASEDEGGYCKDYLAIFKQWLRS